MKSLEKYFQDQPLLPEDPAASENVQKLSSAEQAFLNKYLDVTEPGQVADSTIPPVTPEQVMSGAGQVAEAKTRFKDHREGPAAETVLRESVPGRSSGKSTKQASDGELLQKTLQTQSILQLIGFSLAEQEYALPIETIQEVIRAVEPTKLPAAPAFLSGVINLRGRVTPLISLRTLLGLPVGQDKFVVVCRHGGMQLGLQIQAVSTMHRISQDRIDWGIESMLGVQNDFIAGLIRTKNKRLIGILSLDNIVQTLLTT